jgi:hypothetical protein
VSAPAGTRAASSISNRQLRIAIRWLHIVGGSVTATFIYSPWGESARFAALMRWGVVPLLVLSGVVLWQQHRLSRWRP